MINLQDEPRNRYEILRVVNRGGMGEIALGRVRGAKGFEKLVVLKRLRADAERDDHIAMFDVEQELMSRIEHPNIVKVFDQPVIDATPYLAMEYVRGRNLDQIVRQTKDAGERSSMPFALTVISEVLRGLAFVHRLKDNEGKALGVVHQDITPSNIMVSFFGEVKITDFGISYVTSRDGGLRRGVLKGKPRYVAPEVLAGKRVNNRADIYGVGLVLYELLTQQPLFARASVKETLAAVARGELPDFLQEVPSLGEGTLRIFQRSLAKDPADRYRTAEEMGADVLAELAKVGGAISPARLGYVVRQYFRDDPDVPEVDPSFEAALAAEAQPVLPSTFRPPDLSQTISELDRLLGPRHSTDLFTLPPDLKGELAGIADMDPFLALTPIPDFVWDAPNDAELLRRADQEFGRTFDAMPPAKETPPLLAREEAIALDHPLDRVIDRVIERPAERPGERAPERAPERLPAQAAPPRGDDEPIPSFDALRSKSGERLFDPDPLATSTPIPRAQSSTRARGADALASFPVSPRPLSSAGKERLSRSTPENGIPVPVTPLRSSPSAAAQAALIEAARERITDGGNAPRAHDGGVETAGPPVAELRQRKDHDGPEPEPARASRSSDTHRAPRTAEPERAAGPSGAGSSAPRAPEREREREREREPTAARSEKEAVPAPVVDAPRLRRLEVGPDALDLRGVQPTSTTDTEVSDGRNFQFWLGVGIGMALGLVLGVLLTTTFGGG